MKRSRTPSLITPTLYFIAAVALFSTARMDYPELVTSTAKFAIWGMVVLFGVTLFNWGTYEWARRWREIGAAKEEPARIMSDSLRGHGTQAQEYIYNQVAMDFEGIGDPLVIWRLRLPTGKRIDVGLIQEYLQASREQNNGMLYPVRNHDDSRFRDFVNVEEQLKNLVHEFYNRGWCDRAVGPNPARLRVSIDMIENSLFGQVMG